MDRPIPSSDPAATNPMLSALSVVAVLGLGASACGGEVTLHPGNGLDGVYELTGPVLEAPLPVGAPVRFGLQQMFTGEQECGYSLGDGEVCETPMGYSDLEVMSAECEQLTCTIGTTHSDSVRFPQLLVTAQAPGEGFIRVEVRDSFGSLHEDRWPVSALQPQALHLMRSRLGDAGSHHPVLIGAEFNWKRVLVGHDDDGNEVALAQSRETISMGIEGNEFRQGDHGEDGLVLFAEWPGTAIIPMVAGALERTLELRVADPARVVRLEVIAVDPLTEIDTGPVDVAVDPITDETPLQALDLDGPEPRTFAMQAVLDDGTTALGGGASLWQDPAEHVVIRPGPGRGQPGLHPFFTLGPRTDGDGVLQAQVGDAMLSLDVTVRNAPAN